MEAMALPRVSIGMLACDRPELLARALASVQKHLRHFEYVHAVDVGSTVHGVTQVLHDARQRYGKLRVEHMPHRQAKLARNLILTRAERSGIELMMWLDDDDTYGEGYVEKMQLEWLRLGKPDILVPGEWAAEIGKGGILQQFHSVLPNRLDDFEGWAELFRIGAACGTSIGAFQRMGGFDPTTTGDEWVRKFYRDVLNGARVEIAQVSFDRSYRWLWHNGPDVHDSRRAIESATRAQVVQEVYEEFCRHESKSHVVIAVS